MLYAYRPTLNFYFLTFPPPGNCIFDREWTLQSNSSSGTTNSKQNEDTAKLLYGMIFSLRSVSQKLSSSPTPNNLRTISTGKYRVHILFTASGLLFVLLSDLKQQDLSEVLHYLYSEIYVRFVVNNLLSPIDFAECEDEKRGQGFRKISNRNFIEGIERFLGPMVTQ